MRYASVPTVQSLDDLMGSGPSFVSSLPVADWEAIDNEIGDLWKTKAATKEAEEEEVKEPEDIVKKAKSIDQITKEKVLKINRLEGRYEDNMDELAAKMKYNPAVTPEDWKRAFGKCDAFGCYWPEEGAQADDYYSVGGGGRKNRPSRPQQKASRQNGGVGVGGG